MLPSFSNEKVDMTRQRNRAAASRSPGERAFADAFKAWQQ